MSNPRITWAIVQALKTQCHIIAVAGTRVRGLHGEERPRGFDDPDRVGAEFGLFTLSPAEMTDERHHNVLYHLDAMRMADKKGILHVAPLPKTLQGTWRYLRFIALWWLIP